MIFLDEWEINQASFTSCCFITISPFLITPKTGRPCNFVWLVRQVNVVTDILCQPSAKLQEMSLIPQHKQFAQCMSVTRLQLQLI